jgi:hypothetical protein
LRRHDHGSKHCESRHGHPKLTHCVGFLAVKRTRLSFSLNTVARLVLDGLRSLSPVPVPPRARDAPPLPCARSLLCKRECLQKVFYCLPYKTHGRKVTTAIFYTRKRRTSVESALALTKTNYYRSGSRTLDQMCLDRRSSVVDDPQERMLQCLRKTRSNHPQWSDAQRRRHSHPQPRRGHFSSRLICSVAVRRCSVETGRVLISSAFFPSSSYTIPGCDRRGG